MADDDNVIQFPTDPGSTDRSRKRASGTDAAASGTDAAGLLAHLGALGVDLRSLPPHLQTTLTDSLADTPGASFGIGALLGQLDQLGEPGIEPFGILPGREPELLPRREDVVTYRIRVDLDDVRPPVWRRIDIPSDLPLDRLHDVVQAVMGWWDSHLHAFVMGPGSRDRDIAPFLTAFDVEEGEAGTLEDDVRLDEVLGEPGHRLFYTYDFGDGWDHTLKLEKVLPTGPAGCVGGRRACPPEDCGGVPGYEDIVALYEGREPSGYGPFEDREEMMEWLPEGWHPDEFDREAANEAVRVVVDGGTPGLPPVEELNPALADLLHRTRGTGTERRLVAMALSALADTPGGVLGVDSEEAGPDEATIAAAMRPLQVVLTVIGDGVDLTAAGYLRPAAVEGIAAGIDLGSWWIGKANREDLTPPIAELRTAAQRLGLVRRHRGRLLPTTAGRRLRADAAGLWRHVAEHLPTGSAQQKDPATLLLLAVAGGGIPPEFSSACHEVLGVVGWREGRFTHEQFTAALVPTWESLEALGCFERAGAGAVTDLGMDLATAALRPGSAPRA